MTVSSPATVLCIEDVNAHFAASQQLFGSGYHLVTAGTQVGLFAALRSYRDIHAAVLDLPTAEPQQVVEIATQIETVRPETPKILVSESALTIATEVPTWLNLFSVERTPALLEQLRIIIAMTRARIHTTAALCNQSRILLAETRAVQEKTLRSFEQSIAKLNKKPN